MTDRAVSLYNGEGCSAIVLVCEHASSNIPNRYNNLGLDAQAALSHIAWDPGASLTARHLAKLLDAVLIESEVSRLVYDCNRPPESPGAMPIRSEIYDIPGNKNLSMAERQTRIDSCYRPFEAAVKETLNKRQQSHKSGSRSKLPTTPVLVTIHSFTPVYNGVKRDVEIGVLHDTDTRVADAMMSAVPQELHNFNIVLNEPYSSADGVTHTLKLHGIKNNFPNVMIEIRNDLIQTDAQCSQLAESLAPWLTTTVSNIDAAVGKVH